jgi:hypothetical protein
LKSTKFSNNAENKHATGGVVASPVFKSRMIFCPHHLGLILPSVVALAAFMGGSESCGARTPFRSEDPIARAVAPADDPLGVFELRGILRSKSEIRVCFVDTRNEKSVWLTVGAASSGIIAEQYDSARGAVLARSGGTSRWFQLRENKVVPIPIALMDDGSVDTFHMSLTEEQKADEARAMHGDLLELAWLGRTGRLKPKRAELEPDTSQQR